jgi:hypothetical protein
MKKHVAIRRKSRSGSSSRGRKKEKFICYKYKKMGSMESEYTSIHIGRNLTLLVHFLAWRELGML